jgi:hypothetical protein
MIGFLRFWGNVLLGDCIIVVLIALVLICIKLWSDWDWDRRWKKVK